MEDALARGDWSAVRISCEQILKDTPNDPDALHALGIACWSEGDVEIAAVHVAAAALVRPDAGWSNNLGVMLLSLRKPQDAVAAFRRSIAIDPAELHVHVHLAIALSAAGQADEAIPILQQVLSRDEENARAIISLGRAYRLTGQEREAHRFLASAVDRHPQVAEIYMHLADACLSLQHFDEALRHARRFAELQPGSDSYARLAIAAWEAGSHAEARSARDDAFRFGIETPETHSALLQLSLHDDGESAASLWRSHRLWAVTHCPAGSVAVFGNDADGERQLRIGFVTSRLFHSPATAFKVPLLRSMDRTRFQTFLYLLSPESDGGIADSARRIDGCSDEEAAAQIRSDGIDVLVDLTGHQSASRPRIFGFRPAPVSVVHSGYPSTTGLSCFNAIFSDAELSPEGTEGEYSEPVLRLAGGCFLYEPPADGPPVSPLPALANGFVTFGIFQKSAKLNGGVLRRAAAILHAVPGSELLFHHENAGYDDPSSSAVRRTWASLRELGIEEHRVRFAGPRLGADHWAVVGSVDIGLDTLPYNGHATTCECLWMGVPVVTAKGATHAGRVGASLLAAAGLPELIARSDQEYVRIAASLATDTARLAHLRDGLRARLASSALTAVAAGTREFEDACRILWKQWCSAIAREKC